MHRVMQCSIAVFKLPVSRKRQKNFWTCWYLGILAEIGWRDDKQLMATQENAITHTKQKIEKWSALVKSCREGSCGALYAIQKLEMYQTILNALLQQKECASS